MENRLGDLWSIFDFLNPGLLGSASGCYCPYSVHRSAGLLAVAVIVLNACAHGAAAQEGERGDVHASLRVFGQPASGDSLLVVTPGVSAKVAAVRSWLSFDANWTADVVSGATPRTYGRLDAVSSATRFQEVRNVLGAGTEVHVGPATISAGYAYGIERDYRSNLVRGGLRLDLFNHNTVIAANYSHSFDSVCDLYQAGVPITQRQPLDNHLGCFFSPGPRRAFESLDIDTVELSLTQTLTPRLLAALIGTYQHLDGFQSSPYRQVRLPGGMVAQESHPRVRDRGALVARLRYAVEPVRASLGVDLRLYRDSWGVQSLTTEASWEQPFRRANPNWRFGARARGYVQSGADFYRDAGAADAYEIAGPVGNYFTADQELAPLADLIVGARLIHSSAQSSPQRIWRMFTGLDTTLALDYVKIFALSPEPPNTARTQGWASALVLALSAAGSF